MKLLFFDHKEKRGRGRIYDANERAADRVTVKGGEIFLHHLALGISLCVARIHRHQQHAAVVQQVHFLLAGLVDPLGGGVTINHPRWSKFAYDAPLKYLDHDPRVLGMEVINGKYRDEDYWDHALKTGRQCFGFFVPDWSLWNGCNVLLVKERTVSACLRAYREGNFYGAVHGGRVQFTNLVFNGRTIEAATDKPVKFELISAQGKVAETTGKEFSFKVPASAQSHVYFRLKAYLVDGSGNVLPEADGDTLYGQPFMV